MLRNKSKGYILILLTAFIPVVLLGIKYAMRMIDLNKVRVRQCNPANLYKRCAEPVALEVAKHWDPALSLNAQKSAALRVADKVYDTYPVYAEGAVNDVIYGLDVTKSSKNGTSTTTKMSAKAKKVGYDPLTSTIKRYELTYNGSYDNWRIGQISQVILSEIAFSLSGSTAANSASLSSVYAYNDIVQKVTSSNVMQVSGGVDKFFLYFDEKFETVLKAWATKNSAILTKDASYTGSSSTETYGIRKNINDGSVKIWLDNSKNNSKGAIVVSTDGKDTAYAVPARCDVDIVLSVPVNSAACNNKNKDTNSPIVSGETAEWPIMSPNYPVNPYRNTKSPLSTSTPQYEITQAYRTFLKNNFFNTLGVNVGVIPYSGKLSVSNDNWKINPDKFNANGYLSRYNSSPAAHNYYVRGALLYGTTAESVGQDLDAGIKVSAHGVMSRRGTRKSMSIYGNNYIYHGDILSTANPTANNDYKFLRMPFQPCHPAFANMLSMKAERVTPYCYENPNYLIELTANVRKVYEQLNLMFPFAYNDNVSNFIFIPITWANNLFKEWTADPSKAASDQYLARTSKTEHKKAVILIVNKPDWFEPHEMTYLGFYDDFPEVPSVESDKIDFSIDYSAGKKWTWGDQTGDLTFRDGSKYDGTIQGYKKIIKYRQTTGEATYDAEQNHYVFSGTGVGRLYFPRKALVKIVVRPDETDKARKLFKTWKKYWDDDNDATNTPANQATRNSNGKNGWRYSAITRSGDNVFMANGLNGEVVYSRFGKGFPSHFFRRYRSSGTPLLNGIICDRCLGGICHCPDSSRDITAISYEGRARRIEDLSLALEEHKSTSADIEECSCDGNYWNGIVRNSHCNFTVDIDGTMLLFKDFGLSLQVKRRSNVGLPGNDACNSGMAYGWDGKQWCSIIWTDGGANVYKCDKASSIRYYNSDMNEESSWRKVASPGISGMQVSGYGYKKDKSDGWFLSLQYQGVLAASRDGEKWYKITDFDLTKMWTNQSYWKGGLILGPTTTEQKDSNGNTIYCTFYAMNEAGGIAELIWGEEKAGSSVSFGNTEISGDTYDMTAEKAFTIEPSQIKDTKDGSNYYIDISMTNVQLVSAEITNRPRVLLKVPTIKAYGNWDYANSSARININSKRAFKATFGVAAAPRVQFWGKNGTTLDSSPYNCYTTSAVTSDYWPFSASRFRNNTSRVKLSYSCWRATLDKSNTYLDNQLLRCVYSDMGHNGVEKAWNPPLKDGLVTVNDTTALHYDNNGKGEMLINRAYSGMPPYWSVGKNITSGYSYIGMKRHNNTGNFNIFVGHLVADRVQIRAGTRDDIGGNKVMNKVTFNGVEKDDDNGTGQYYVNYIETNSAYTNVLGWCYNDSMYSGLSGTAKTNIDTGHYWSAVNPTFTGDRTVLFNYTSSDRGWWCFEFIFQFVPNFVNSNGMTVTIDPNENFKGNDDGDAAVGYVCFKNSDRIYCGGTNTNNLDVTGTNSGTVSFYGEGDLHIGFTIDPAYINGVIQSSVAEKGSQKVIEITPESFTYTLQSDGTYNIDIPLKWARLESIDEEDFKNRHRDCDFKTPQLENNYGMCDFRNSSNANTSYLSRFASGMWHDGSAPGSAYDAEVGLWCSSGGGNALFDNDPQYRGYMYNTYESIGSVPAFMTLYYECMGKEWTYTPGLVRFSYDERGAFGNTGYTFKQGRGAFLAGGMVSPINTMLYYGAFEGKDHKYTWQANSSGAISQYNPTEAVKQVTKDACAKLQSDYKSTGIRIYVIKYRAQPNYEYPYRGSNIKEHRGAYLHSTANFDYSYLNSCAYNGTSTTTDSPYLQSASDPTELEIALQKIADDIKDKEWSGYTEAQLL